MTEPGYTQAIHRYLPAWLYRWKINTRFQAGVPDAWYSGPGADLWVEYKYEPRLPREVTPKLSALQKKWLNERLAEGRNVAVVVGSPQGSLILRDGAWNTPTPRPTTLLTKKAIAQWIIAQVQ